MNAGAVKKRDFTTLEGFAYFLSAVGIQFFTFTFLTFAHLYYSPPQDKNNPNQVMYITLFMVSFIMTFGRIMDAVSDPLVGYWSDRTRHRLGRRRPWIIYASVPTFITFIAFWFPPVPGFSYWNFIYALVVSSAFWWAITMVLIPLLALTPEVGGSKEGRVKFATWWGYGLAIGLVLAILCPRVVEKFGVKAMALIYGSLGFLCFQFAGWVIKERFDLSQPVEQSSKGVLREIYEQYREAFQIRAFGILVAAETIFTMGLFLINIIIVEYSIIVLGKNGGFATNLLAPFIIVCLIASAFIPMLAKKTGKKFLYSIGLGGFGVAFLFMGGVGLLPLDARVAVAILVVAIAGIPQSVKYILPYTLIGDIADLDEKKRGERREGVFSGALGFCMKMGSSLSYFIRFAVYRPFGEAIDVHNPVPVMLFGPITCILCFFAVWLFYRYYPELDKTAKT